jgi:geranylgeranyl pyrophosphate synthase
LILDANYNKVDPFELVAEDLSTMSDSIKDLLCSKNTLLQESAQYPFQLDGGKKVRPALVLLLSRAAHKHALANPSSRLGEISSEEDMIALEAAQRRLAEVTEMIHVASLNHDDVIDDASTRRGAPSINQKFGNKMAIMAGDFLLARASIGLARLRNEDVVEIMASVLEHLVKGEVMQMRSQHMGKNKNSKSGGAVDTSGDIKAVSNSNAFEHYLRKNYNKTGSLMANSCRAAMVLGKHSVPMQRLAFGFGKHIGAAFQLIDDVLDFEGSAKSLGKPAMADLKAGLATAPVLFAQEEHPQLGALIQRKFERAGDVEEAIGLVMQSSGLENTKQLALSQAECAIAIVRQLSPSPERDALEQLARVVIERSS